MAPCRFRALQTPWQIRSVSTAMCRDRGQICPMSDSSSPPDEFRSGSSSCRLNFDFDLSFPQIDPEPSSSDVAAFPHHHYATIDGCCIITETLLKLFSLYHTSSTNLDAVINSSIFQSSSEIHQPIRLHLQTGKTSTTIQHVYQQPQD